MLGSSVIDVAVVTATNEQMEWNGNFAKHVDSFWYLKSCENE